MSYIPRRDNPEIDGLSDEDVEMILTLSDVIDASSQRGNHADSCSQFCDRGEDCPRWTYREAGSEETIQWLVAQGVLSMSVITSVLAQRGYGS